MRPLLVRRDGAPLVIIDAGAGEKMEPKLQEIYAFERSENLDASLKATLAKYVVEFLRRNPTTNTYLGGAGLDASLRAADGTLRDYSDTAIQAEDVWLQDVFTSIEEIPTSQLSAAARIDREVAMAQIRFLLRQHQIRHYQQRALDTYVTEPFRALDFQLQGMSETGKGTYGTDEEWALVISRVNAIPKFLATAQAPRRGARPLLPIVYGGVTRRAVALHSVRAFDRPRWRPAA